MDQTVKDLPAMQEIRLNPWVGKILWKRDGYPLQLEKEMATHSSTLAWKIPWTEEPGRL